MGPLSRRDTLVAGGGLVAYSATDRHFGIGGLKEPAWVRRAPTVSVLDYGGVGDGRHDDAPAVQRAIDRVGVLGGGTVVFPPQRSYLLDRQISLCDNLTVLGLDGARLVVGRSFAGIERPLFKNFEGTTFTRPDKRTARENIAIIDLEIDGGDVGLPGRTLSKEMMRGAMICLGGWADHSGVQNAIVRGCYLHGFAGAGAMMWNSTDIEISANRFEDFFADEGLSLGSGIDLHAVRRVEIRENMIRHTAAGLSWHGMVVLDWEIGSDEVTIVGNMISDLNGGDGISCEGNRGAGSNLVRSRIAGNTIIRCGGQGIGVDNCHDVLVEDNRIDQVTGPGILFTGTLFARVLRNRINDSGLGGILSTSGTQQAIIRGNQLAAIRHHDAQYRGEGISVTAETGAARVEIINNVLSDIEGAGIYHVANGMVSGNTIVDGGKSPKLDASLRAAIVGTAPSRIFCNTIVSKGATAFAISSAAGDFPSIAGNRISGPFHKDYFYIAYRGGRRVDVSITAENASYDDLTNLFQAYYQGVPTGFWFKGDTFFTTASSTGDAPRLVATGAPAQWRKIP